MLAFCAFAVLVLGWAFPVFAGGRYVEVSYPASANPAELQIPVTYTLWIPPGSKPLRGILVHQHGCGAPAARSGSTAAYDLHWQGLAAKWNLGLLGPYYQQKDGEDCRLWCDPRRGSDSVFLRALSDLSAKSSHPEVASIPWYLWGHSGGGLWSGVMQMLHPDRIAAIWFRSGVAFARLDDVTLPEAAYRIPSVLNPGAKEKGHQQFDAIWTSNHEAFRRLRAKGAPVALAVDPRTGHECGDSRYLAIPFFDAILAGRAKGVEDPQWGWLPNAHVAHAWKQYTQTGTVNDTTPPPAPWHLKAASGGDGKVTLTWDAEVDFESGLQQFVILRDGQEIGRVPEKPAGKFGRPLFQSMTYHDTPERPLPEMTFVDAAPRAKARYQVTAINSAGLASKPSSSAKAN